MRCFAQHRDVADLHAGIARRLQPEQPRTLEQLRLRVVRGGRHAQHDAHLGEVLLHQHARGVVGVRRHDDDIPRPQHRSKDCRARRHAGGEDQRGSPDSHLPDSICPMAFSSDVQVGLCDRA